jgi:hypothetical protein
MRTLNHRGRIAAAAAMAFAGVLVAGVAQAREPDVQWSVTISSPGVAYPVPPVLVPVPVYQSRVPVYQAPVPLYQVPVPVYRRPVPVYAPARYRAPTPWDRDGDGIPNRYDRLYNPVWDRDGDGIPNRHDARHAVPWDRDGDGVTNRHDRDDWRTDRGMQRWDR